MSADKRSVTTDAMDTLGTILTEDEKRDAIHLAVDNVVAAHTLRPGEDVGFLEGGAVGVCDDPVGIVDPFLKNAVKKGERFWLVVYPRTITSLRHVWSHPAFADAPAVAGGSAVVDVPTVAGESAAAISAKAWLRDYARSLGVSYEALLEHASAYQKYGEYWNEGERFESEYVPEVFWTHYESAMGNTAEVNRRGSFFSCSC